MPEDTIVPEGGLCNSRPWIVGDYNGVPWIAWKKPVGDGVHGPDIVYSRWNGTDWDSIQPVSHTIRGDYAPVLATGGGELWVIWWGDTTGVNPVRNNTYASRWNGVSWDPEMLVSHPDTGYDWGHEWQGHLAVDDSGNPHVVWHTWLDGSIYYRTYDGDSWLDPVAIVDTSDELWGEDADIAIDDSGQFHVVFTGPGSMSSRTDIYYTQSSDGQNWTTPYQIHIDDTTDEKSDIECTNSSNLWITWHREISLWDLHVCVSHFDGNTWSNPTVLDDSTTEADHAPTIALDTLGKPWVIWGGMWEHIYNHFTLFDNRYIGSGIWEDSPIFPMDSRQEIMLKIAPNPFQDRLQITFLFPESSIHSDSGNTISLRIYSSSGQLIRELSSSLSDPGVLTWSWDGCNALGNRTPRGVYLINLSTQKNSLTEKVLKLR
jgi:hypothetical protein